MTSTEIAVRDNGNGVVAERDIIDGWVAMAADVFKLAAHICDTDFVPKAYRGNAPAVAAAILTGRELGIGPMTSLRHVQVVEGSPTLSAEYKRARVLAAGHEFAIVELNSTRCRVKGRRRGSGEPPTEFTYTMDDAKRAKLIRDRSGWLTRPRRMLFARAGTDLCDALFADVTNGLPTTELLAEGTDDDLFAGYNEADGHGQPQNGKSRTAQRKPRTTDASPAHPAGTQPTVAPAMDAPAQQGASAGEAPPLPDEVDSVPAAPDTPPAAGTVPPDDSDYDVPGTVTRPQLTKLGATFTSLGFTAREREQRLTAASQITGRELSSSSELSFNEVKVLIDTLERCGTRDNLIALLAASEEEGTASDG